MAVNIVLGPTAKVDIGPSQVPFRVVTGHISDAADVNETTDSETLYSSKGAPPLRVPGGPGIEMEIQLDTDTPNPTVGMFLNTIGMTPGNRMPIHDLAGGSRSGELQLGLPERHRPQLHSRLHGEGNPAAGRQSVSRLDGVLQASLRDHDLGSRPVADHSLLRTTHRE